MRACRISINNFRGIKSAQILLSKHSVLIGDNNTGKTTVLEALDLTLGPDRLNRRPPIDEHDFYQGQYLPNKFAPVEAKPSDTNAVIDPEDAEDDPTRIIIEVVIADLSEEQKARFGDYLEFWDSAVDKFYDDPNAEGVDAENIVEILRVTFHGWYDQEEDDFEGKTYFTRSLTEADKPVEFRKKDKQICGFLYLRSLRTGSRALSLERGSLLDIILRIKEVRPKMWEDTIDKLSGFSVAEDPEIGLSGVLESINTSLKKYVPKEWGVEPHLKVSTLTRDHLRKVITAFIATGNDEHAAPFYRQGTGTINMLVLAMLSQIADEKQSVIFAMEEPETAIPPYAQKRIVHEIRSLATQAIFTSHSPYVLEEFALDETIVLDRDAGGQMSRTPLTLPENLKLKTYRQEFRTRFCEGLLSRRVLIAEGETETTAFPVVCRRLSELNPDKFNSLEALGICILNAGSETKIPSMAKLFRGLGKRTFALCDKQNEENHKKINDEIELLLMHDEKGFEKLVLEGTTQAALERFAHTLEWPPHILKNYPVPADQAYDALKDYFSWSKGSWGVADFIAQCSEDEIPQWLRDACEEIKMTCNSPLVTDTTINPVASEVEATPNEAD